jgi:ubiquinone/menaquinone biosynthesis C-methylase UbiE
MERVAHTPELLDGPLDPVALPANLTDLRRINRLLGGVALSRRALDALVGAGGADAGVTLLDVGTGAADIPVALLADWRRRGRRLHVTAVDSRPEILAAAVAARPSIRRAQGLTLALADGAALPFDDGAFDVAHASLVVHHLEPDEAVAFLAELARVARRGVIVNDLVRSRLAWLGAIVVGHTIAPTRYTRHDAPLSVRRAYTRPELRQLLGRAGLRPVTELSGFAGHRVAMAAVATDRAPGSRGDSGTEGSGT